MVDDDQDARDLIEAVLVDAGAFACAASSVKEGLVALAEFKPDVVVSDIGMPGDDGYAFIHRIRALPRAAGGAVAAVALTAYARAEDRVRLLAAGFDNHVAKPVDATSCSMSSPTSASCPERASSGRGLLRRSAVRTARRLAGDDLLAANAERHLPGGALAARSDPLLFGVVEHQLARSDTDAVAVTEPGRLANDDAVHTGSIPAPQIDGLDVRVVAAKDGVGARHEVVIDADGARRIPTDGGLRLGEVDHLQTKAKPERHEPIIDHSRGGSSNTCACVTVLQRRASSSSADPPRGPDDFHVAMLSHLRCMEVAGRHSTVTRRNELECLSTSADQLGVERIQEIQWSHPRLMPLSDAARLVYACLVDGLSSTARETIDSVDLVWRNRYRARDRYVDAVEMREALDEICLAVEELIASGLLVMLDRSTISRGWVMRPWETPPS